MNFLTIKNILIISLSLLPVNAIANNKDIQLGIYTKDTSIVTYNKLGPLINYLTKTTGLNIIFKPNSNLDSTVNDIAKGHTTIAYLTHIGYVKAHKNNPDIIPLVSPIVNNSIQFTFVIATLKTSPTNNTNDLKGKSFAYHDPKSLTQKYVIYETGLTNDDFSDFDYLYDFNNISKAILAEDFNAGILKDTTFNLFKTQGLKEVYRSQPIPNHVFAVNKSLSAENISKIEKAFLKLNTKEHSYILSTFLQGCTGFGKTDDKNYNITRKIISKFK